MTVFKKFTFALAALLAAFLAGPSMGAGRARDRRRLARHGRRVNRRHDADPRIEETFSPSALKLTGAWIRARLCNASRIRSSPKLLRPIADCSVGKSALVRRV